MIPVSVILPVYNMDMYIEEALQSVLGQTFRDFEVIVVDDGSTDRTPDKLQRYASQIRLLHQPNRGCPSALNQGIREARGEWITWISADDIWEPMKLERQLEAARRNPRVRMVYSDFVYIDRDGRILSGEHFPCPPTRRETVLRLIRRSFISQSYPLIHHEVFATIGLYDETDRLTFDWDMALRVALAFDLAYVPEPLVRYRIHEAQASARGDLAELASRRVASRTFRRMGTLLGAWAALLVLRRQIRTFPAGVRRSVRGRTVSQQVKDIFGWLVVLVNPEATVKPIGPPARLRQVDSREA